jgi:hypothetical protein
MEFIIDGRFVLSSNPFRPEPNTASELLAEIERQRQCHRAYCLNCKHVQPCEFDDVFICEECGWKLGEAIP